MFYSQAPNSISSTSLPCGMLVSAHNAKGSAYMLHLRTVQPLRSNMRDTRMARFICEEALLLFGADKGLISASHKVRNSIVRLYMAGMRLLLKG